MLSSAVAVVALVGLVAPGFLVFRIASNGRASVASIGDLELVVRALTFSVVIQLPLFASGWTGELLADVDDGYWRDHTLELVGYVGATYVTTLLVGAVLAWALPKLERQRSGRWRFLFHAVGGQDARDAFDYLFQRRESERFMVVVRTEPRTADEDGRHAGVWGAKSYFGLSPRPHDLLLEEMWKFDANDNLHRLEPVHEGWFAAESIKDLYLRPLPKKDDQEGATPGFGTSAIRAAIYQSRRDIATQMTSRWSRESRESTMGSLERHAREASEAGVRPEGSVDALRDKILLAGGLALTLIGELRDDAPVPEENAALEAGQAGDYPPPWALWSRMLDYYSADAQREDREGTQTRLVFSLLRLTALCINAVLQIDETRDED